jgi:hypothetical protein
VITPPDLSIMVRMKGIVKDLLSLCGLYDARQFWGYLRTLEEQRKLLLEAGFDQAEVGFFSHGTYWLKANKDD